ncbi:MAG: hypothetical protein U0R49_05815 [Fimbriimonadales bacterium]
MVAATIFAGLALASAPKSVEITIYNGNFGLIKEVRAVQLKDGRQELRVEDVPSSIDPTSVGIRSLTNGFPIEMLEQNYQYDLLSPEAILAKSVGKRVRFRQQLQNGQQVITEGILMSLGNVVIKTDDGRIILNPQGSIEVMEIPAGLISKPTLMWDLVADKSGPHDLEVAYLTNNIDWSADYVLTLNADDSKADLNGWVTINNRCGATWNDAKLKLVAGDVRRIREQLTSGRAGGFGGGGLRAKEAGFEEQQLFEYHLYTLGRPATVRNNETKQIALLSAADVDVHKDLIFEGQKSYWYSYGRNYRPGEGYATDAGTKVNIVVEVTNSDKNKLGMPLPKGKVRVYKRDSSGQVQMVGEDQIDHTPREEKIKLYIGDAFDIVGERKRTEFKIIASNIIRETFEIKLRNRKKTAETVRVMEHAWSEWTILNETMKSEKVDSNSFQYVVKLQPDKEEVIRYTVETRWP